MKQGERAESLLEVVVAGAIVAVTLGALLSGTFAAAHRFGPDLVHESLRRYADQELHVGADLLKYQGASLPPASIETSIPMPGSSPLNARVTLAVSPLPFGATAIAVTAQSDDNSRENVTVQNVIERPAPLPSSTVQSGLFVPAPVGAQ